MRQRLNLRPTRLPGVSVSSTAVDDWIEVTERYKQLVEKINFHNHRYYVLDSPEVSDAEYDQLMEELRAIEADHPELQSPESPTQRVGAGPSEQFPALPHPTPTPTLATPS